MILTTSELLEPKKKELELSTNRRVLVSLLEFLDRFRPSCWFRPALSIKSLCIASRTMFKIEFKILTYHQIILHSSNMLGILISTKIAMKFAILPPRKIVTRPIFWICHFETNKAPNEKKKRKILGCCKLFFKFNFLVF